MQKASNRIKKILVDAGSMMNLIYSYHFDSVKLNNAGGKII